MRVTWPLLRLACCGVAVVVASLLWLVACGWLRVAGRVSIAACDVLVLLAVVAGCLLAVVCRCVMLNVFCRCVLQLCFAIAICNRVLQSCFEIALLQLCFAIVLYNRVLLLFFLQLRSAFICCTCALDFCNC